MFWFLFALGLGGGPAYDWKRGWPWASLAKDRAQELGGTLAEKVKERLKPARAAHGSYVEHQTDTSLCGSHLVSSLT